MDIHCPKCNSVDSHVLRTTEKNEFILRKRECNKCGWRYNTKEMPSDEWVYKTLYNDIVRKLNNIMRDVKKYK